MSKPDIIRLATFNIRHGAPAEKSVQKGNPEALAEACASLDADILALQEVDKGVARSGWKDLARLAAEASGMEYVFARSMWFRGGQYGNALLVRGEIEDVEQLRLTGGRRHRLPFKIKGKQPKLFREPRSAIVATAHVRDKKVSVAATHLATETAVSSHQLQTVLGATMRRPGPRVLMGDFNRSTQLVARYPLPSGLMLVDSPPTFPALNPKKSIDHIIINGLTLYSVETRRLDVSDHLALIVDVV